MPPHPGWRRIYPLRFGLHLVLAMLVVMVYHNSRLGWARPRVVSLNRDRRSYTMTKVSFELPATITVALGKDTGDRLVIETKRLAPHANLWPAFVTAAMKVIMTNAFNGGGKDAKHADKVAA